MMGEQEHKVCVVTGASSGIGRRTCLDLAQDGAKVVAFARREDRLASLIEEMGGEPHSFVVGDVSVRKDVTRLAAHVEEAYGRCDALVNNAGFSTGGGYGNGDGLADLKRVMATNFFGAANCLSVLLPLLERSAPSSVVNVASIAGRLAVGSSSYTASKFALVGWSESLSYELAPRGISVSLVEPGLIPTEGFPQEMFVNSGAMRIFLGSEAGVSKTIRRAVDKPKIQRMTPKWYYLLQLPRLLTPPLYRAFAERYAGIGRTKQPGRKSSTK